MSCTFLNHQQGHAWRSSSWVYFCHVTHKGTNQLMSSTAGHQWVSVVARRTQHILDLLGTTGSLSNVLGTSQRRCSTSVPLHSLYLFLTSSPSTHSPLTLHHPSTRQLESAERATQIQQLLWPSLA